MFECVSKLNVLNCISADGRISQANRSVGSFKSSLLLFPNICIRMKLLVLSSILIAGASVICLFMPLQESPSDNEAYS